MEQRLKINRLKKLISKLKDGEQVTPRNLKLLLSKEDLEEIKLAWEEEKSSREISKPSAIIKYEKLLQKACSYYALMEKYLGEINGNSFLAKEFGRKSDIAFEQALEFIREAEHNNPEIAMWLDRDAFEAIDWDPISVPRVIGSRSIECQVKRKNPYPLQTKREVKIQVLEEIVKRMTGELEKDSLEPFMVELPPSRKTRLTAFDDLQGFTF